MAMFLPVLFQEIVPDVCSAKNHYAVHEENPP